MKDVKFMLGANYWGSKWATDMWCKYDKESIRDDLKTLAKYDSNSISPCAKKCISSSDNFTIFII